MGAISLGDRLHFSFASSDRLECDDPSIPLSGDNLVWKAARLFRHESGCSTPLHITLTKRIPAQAGLGGGSSNAATTLWALNDLFDRPFTTDRLIDLAARLGSDVPFFFAPGFALAQGRGERITPLASLILPPCTVAKPRAESLSTPAVYKETRVEELTTHKMTPFFNDLEPASFRLLPQLKAVKEELLSCGFTQVVMTGSGSAFFCFGSSSQSPPSSIALTPVHFLSRSSNAWWSDSNSR